MESKHKYILWKIYRIEYLKRSEKYNLDFILFHITMVAIKAINRKVDIDIQKMVISFKIIETTWEEEYEWIIDVVVRALYRNHRLERFVVLDTIIRDNEDSFSYKYIKKIVQRKSFNQTIEKKILDVVR